MLSYLFWPNPQSTSYDNPKVMALVAVCALMVIVSFALSVLRKRKGNTVMRKLTRSWSAALVWFGSIGLILVVARVEQISYISMRVWWIVWMIGLALFVYVQFRRWRMMYYEVLPHHHMDDPREKYLPRRKK